VENAGLCVGGDWDVLGLLWVVFEGKEGGGEEVGGIEMIFAVKRYFQQVCIKGIGMGNYGIYWSWSWSLKKGIVWIELSTEWCEAPLESSPTSLGS